MTDKQDTYTRVTNKIIAELEAGTRPWHRPWGAEHLAGRVIRARRHNGTPYKGINTIMLWAASAVQGYAAPIWMTYKQAQELGGQVRKGSKGETVVYANKMTKTETDKNGQDHEVAIPFMKGYCVFNVEQIDDLPDHYYAPAAPVLDPVQRIDQAEAFFSATAADVRHGGSRAYYELLSDRIQMPPFEAFVDVESYYSTLAHECTHWTRHPKRLNRDFGRKRWGDAGYAQEELVAEIGAAFLCADLGLSPETRKDHADYIASWLSVLKTDKRAIFSAAAHAQRAADYLHALSSRPAARAAA